ncbi:uncharacterized protein LOC142334781 [Convolutriloba macropyga]|uniref:uncharacterized protein LOC142334781 n=1 Tax=Convolutriloba macropyga TaxID=536237 RepID=UPI003F520D91
MLKILFFIILSQFVPKTQSSSSNSTIGASTSASDTSTAGNNAGSTSSSDSSTGGANGSGTAGNSITGASANPTTSHSGNSTTSGSDLTTGNSTSPPNSTGPGPLSQNGNPVNSSTDAPKPIVQDIKCIDEASTPGYLKCMIKQALDVEKAGNSSSNQSEMTEGAETVKCINKIDIYASTQLKTITLNEIRDHLDRCLADNGIGAGIGDVSVNGFPVQAGVGPATKRAGDANFVLPDMSLAIICILTSYKIWGQLFVPIGF